MSQFFINSTAAPSPPADVQKLTADDEDSAVTSINQPSASDVSAILNKIVVNGDNGITTYHLTNGALATNILQIGFIRDTVQTVDAETQTILSLTTFTDTCFTTQVLVSGISTDNLGIGGYTTVTVKNIGGTVSIIDEFDIIMQSDTDLNAGYFSIEVSGANVLIKATGVNTKTITWNACTPGIVYSTK